MFAIVSANWMHGIEELFLQCHNCHNWLHEFVSICTSPDLKIACVYLFEIYSFHILAQTCGSCLSCFTFYTLSAKLVLTFVGKKDNTTKCAAYFANYRYLCA